MSRGVFVPALEAPVDIGDLAVDRIVPPVAAQIAAVGSANAIVSGAISRSLRTGIG
jgi:hypothetical protein